MAEAENCSCWNVGDVLNFDANDHHLFLKKLLQVLFLKMLA